MPQVIPLAISAGGAVAGASQGKKGNSSANKLAQQQLDLQKQQMAFGTGLINKGISEAWQPSANYWNVLLKGDPTAVAQATGPYQDLIRQNAATTEQGIQSSAPLGGERNLALAQNQIQASNNTARLYAGMQPTAAAALGQLAGLPVQSGVGVTGQAAPNVSSAGKAFQNSAQAGNAKGGQLGNSLGQLIARGQNKGSGKGSGNPTAPGDPSICWIAQALYGDDDPRVNAIRAYLLGPFSQSLHGRMIVELYRRTGQRIAALARRYSFIAAALRPLFDHALTLAEASASGAAFSAERKG